jgi:glyoxylase-like metal-dependent hydrolase (beta-lactamase superfamily II)
MRRAITLGVLLAAGALSLTLAAFQQPPAGQPAERVVEVQKLKDNLYVLRGGGGASSVFVTANGVVVVDTKLPGWGQPLLDTIKTLTNRPVTMIVNTHTHGDHVSGNVDFPAEVDIVTHQNTAANMKEMRPNSSAPPTPNPPNIFRDNNGKGLPKRTFTDRMTIGSGNDAIELHYFGRAHTNGDAFVLFPVHSVLHVADTFPGTELPIMDANNGGTGVGYADTLAKVASFAAERKVDTLVSGHSATTTTPADLQNYIQFIRGYVKDAQAAKSAGRSVDDFANGWKPPTGYTAQAARVRSDAQLIYTETR